MAKQLPPVGQTCRLEMHCGNVKKDAQGNEKAKDKPYNFFWDILSVTDAAPTRPTAPPAPAVTEPGAQPPEMGPLPYGDDPHFGSPPPPAGDGKGDFQPPEVQFQLPPPDKQALIIKQCALKAAVQFHSASMELEPETIDDDTAKVLETATRFYQWVIAL